MVNVEAAVLKEGRYPTVVRGEGESHAPGALALSDGEVEDAGTATDVLDDALGRELIEEVGMEVAAEMAYVQSSAFVADEDDPVIHIVFLRKERHGNGARPGRGSGGAVDERRGDPDRSQHALVDALQHRDGGKDARQATLVEKPWRR
jgi:hypothetical protein